MSKPISRSSFLCINKFQRLIIYPSFFLSVFAFFMTYLCLKYFITEAALNYKIDIDELRWIVYGVLIILGILIFSLMAWISVVANKILGPSERIINELDEVISGKKNQPLRARKGDELFEELLKRINILIERKK